MRNYGHRHLFETVSCLLIWDLQAPVLYLPESNSQMRLVPDLPQDLNKFCICSPNLSLICIFTQAFLTQCDFLCLERQLGSKMMTKSYYQLFCPYLIDFLHFSWLYRFANSKPSVDFNSSWLFSFCLSSFSTLLKIHLCHVEGNCYSGNLRHVIAILELCCLRQRWGHRFLWLTLGFGWRLNFPIS